MFSIGNDTFDNFLGGGFLKSTVNIFERQGPSSKILDSIINKSIASSTLCKKNNILYVNCNTAVHVSKSDILAALPSIRQVKSEVLFKDVRGTTATAKIQIAWRYSQRNPFSPSDVVQRVNQIDFGLSLMKESHDIGELEVVQIKSGDNLATLINEIEAKLQSKSSNSDVVVIIKDLLHPFSPFAGVRRDILELLYTLRCLARKTNTGAIVLCYDTDMCPEHELIKEKIYNLADTVVSMHSYETDENKLTGYKDIDGTLSYIKVPKINSYGFHFQQNLSDWGYRLTKNHRYFVVDELSLPPCEDDSESNQMGCKPKAQNEIIKIDNVSKSLERANPLEEFREVARDILPRKLS